ncbi:hypothetical protein ACFFRR_003685 [Megaselia abdita]
MLFVLQLFIGLGNIVYFGIGIGYIDDNTRKSDSPAGIGAIIAAKVFGAQLGNALTFIVSKTPLGWWLGWVIISPLLFISGVIICLFPRKLMKTVVRQAAHQIYRTNSQRDLRAQNNQQSPPKRQSEMVFIQDFRYCPSSIRILTNKPLMFNILGAMFIMAAVMNYQAQEDNYAQSRFYLPSSSDNEILSGWSNRYLSFMLKPPVIAATILIGGLVIAKLKPAARKIVTMNIVHIALLVVIFIILIFIKCHLGPLVDMKNNPWQQCSYGCQCELNEFYPVCPENGTFTYFSPCQAGCKSLVKLNGLTYYDHCQCGANTVDAVDVKATIGGCNSQNCLKGWIAFQVLNVLASSLLGACFVGKTVITLRTAIPQDKVLALAMSITFFSIFANIPAKLAYDAVSYITCEYWNTSKTKCLLRATPLHGNVLNIMSAVLVLIGILFEVLVYIFVKDVDCYKDPFDDLTNSYIPNSSGSDETDGFTYMSVPKDHESDHDVGTNPLIPDKRNTFKGIFAPSVSNSPSPSSVTRQPSAAGSSASTGSDPKFPIYAQLMHPKINKEDLRKTLKPVKEGSSMDHLDYADLELRPRMDSVNSFTGQLDNKKLEVKQDVPETDF